MELFENRVFMFQSPDGDSVVSHLNMNVKEFFERYLVSVP